VNGRNRCNKVTLFDFGWEKLKEIDRGREGERERETNTPLWNRLSYRGEDPVNQATKEKIKRIEGRRRRSSVVKRIKRAKEGKDRARGRRKSSELSTLLLVKLSELALNFFFLYPHDQQAGKYQT